jgi:hypothetical protein
MVRVGKSGLAGFLVSMLILCLALGTILKGRLQYSNYWGGAVFAPFALLIGALGMVASIMSWWKQRR